jgi:nicotinamide mononucleotide adenylyltransferase
LLLLLLIVETVVERMSQSQQQQQRSQSSSIASLSSLYPPAVAKHHANATRIRSRVRDAEAAWANTRQQVMFATNFDIRFSKFKSLTCFAGGRIENRG